MSCTPCNSNNETNFKFVDQRLTFQRAQRVCQELYDGEGHLATFEGEDSFARASKCCEFETRRWIGFHISNKCFDSEGRRTVQPVSRNECVQTGTRLPNGRRFQDGCFGLTLESRTHPSEFLEAEPPVEELEKCARKVGFVCERSINGLQTNETFLKRTLAMKETFPLKNETSVLATQSTIQSNQLLGTETKPIITTEPTHSDTTPGNVGIPIAAIAGGVVGILLLLLLFIACLCLRKRKSKQRKTEFEQPPNKQIHHLNEREKNAYHSNTKSSKHVYVNESKVEYVNVLESQQQQPNPKAVETDLYLNGTPGFPATVPTMVQRQVNGVNSASAYENENAGNYLEMEDSAVPDDGYNTYEELIG